MKDLAQTMKTSPRDENPNLKYVVGYFWQDNKDLSPYPHFEWQYATSLPKVMKPKSTSHAIYNYALAGKWGEVWKHTSLCLAVWMIIFSLPSINLDHRAAGDIGSFFNKSQRYGRMGKEKRSNVGVEKKSNMLLNECNCPHIVFLKVHCNNSHTEKLDWGNSSIKTSRWLEEARLPL